ncbi:hypothetical protein [uncultured Maribacter sp.]|uniref:hypothetical protein n=1 Tax=uncultured Maribacter sp. TaxID=431308 RepID=UPI00261A4DAD|nr:hypothetical protein [uncultured Maribacter sp.]
MQISHFKKYLAYTFLALFLSLKVASLHAITHHHDGDIEHCEVCDLTSVNNFTPLLNNYTETPIGNNFLFYAIKNIVSDYSFTYNSNANIDDFFSRPPPFSI